ncbi:MAG: Mth938-like domain-containing protein [Candidatus Parcubacteria bacterium]|nr:Mth938-like domain-containing protein [Burkholderiales bacterium]
MKLHASTQSALNTFSGYGAGFVLVNGQRHDSSLIVMPEKLLRWDALGFDELKEADFEPFLELNPEILLLGTGPKQRFPHPGLLQALTRKRIGVEAMDLMAACRTYNILMAEERRVAAALLFA